MIEISGETIIRGFLVALLSGAMAYVVYTVEANGAYPEENKQRYRPLIVGYVLPLYLVSLGGLSAAFGSEEMLQNILSICFCIFLQICLYYAVLLSVLPLLRRRISAVACAMLWLVPNYLYIAFNGLMELVRPRLVLHASAGLLRTLSLIWLAGAIAVMGWKILSHLIFRRRLLREAQEPGEALLAQWREELERANVKKPKWKLVISPQATTPLSIGLWPRTTRVVLPERTYSREELTLILRHEIVHLSRMDAWGKFFLAFCTAICWFNPLMWVAMRKSADDLELSCDEAVAAELDEAERRRYASLLLDTAGDERGFTTCLSASSKALRYRLRGIVHPLRRTSGALTVGLVFFILCMSCGYVSLAVDSGTVGDQVWPEQDTAYAITDLERKVNGRWVPYICLDETAFRAYLAALPTSDVMGRYSYSEDIWALRFDLKEGSAHWVRLTDDLMETWPRDKAHYEYAYLPQRIDWDYLDTLLLREPELTVRYMESTPEGDRLELSYAATLMKLIDLTQEKVLAQEDVDPEYLSGFSNGAVTWMDLDFFWPPAEDFTVEVVPLSEGEPYTLTMDAQDTVLPVTVQHARYIVRATLAGENGTRYQAEYQFILENGE